MNKEFNLSEDGNAIIWDREDGEQMITMTAKEMLKSVKSGIEKSKQDFAEILKKELSNPRMFDDNPVAVAQAVAEKIDKLAGPELTGEQDKEEYKDWLIWRDKFDEFIELLKEELTPWIAEEAGMPTECYKDEVARRIDKLAGSELIGEQDE